VQSTHHRHSIGNHRIHFHIDPARVARALADLSASSVPLLKCTEHQCIRCRAPTAPARSAPFAQPGHLCQECEAFAPETPLRFFSLDRSVPSGDVGFYPRRSRSVHPLPISSYEHLDTYQVIPKNGDSSIKTLCTVVYRTLISNPSTNYNNGNTENNNPNLLNGGHFERFSAWSHIVGFVIFLAYAIARSVVSFQTPSTPGTLATLAGFMTAFTFLTSSIYHATAASQTISYYTRLLDYFGVYTGIAVGAVTDICIATDGVQNTPIHTIVDIPIATCLIFGFFVARRIEQSSESTWKKLVVNGDGGRSLAHWTHSDLVHGQLREATTLLIASGYFISIPVVVGAFGVAFSSLVLMLQVSGFLLVVFSMAVEKVTGFPDNLLLKNERSCLVCSGCGCFLNSHALWHINSLLGAGLMTFGRELMLDKAR